MSYSISELFFYSFLIIEDLDFILLSDRVSLFFFISVSEFILVVVVSFLHELPSYLIFQTQPCFAGIAYY